MFSITKIVNDIETGGKTFVGWLCKQYAALYKNEPTIDKVVDTTIDYVQPALCIVMQMEGAGAAVPEVNAIIDEVQADLHVVGALIYDFGPSPTAADITKSIQNKLSDLATAGHIKNPATAAKLQIIVKVVGVLAMAIAKAVAQSTPIPVATVIQP